VHSSKLAGIDGIRMETSKENMFKIILWRSVLEICVLQGLERLAGGSVMPYPPHHGKEVKKRIIDSARRLFNRRGFESVSIAQIMADAGLTHGGFYKYFQSKSDLYAEVMNCFFTDPDWKNCWEGVHVDLSASDVGAQVVKAYLSRQHYDDVENSCPMVALPTDVARSGVPAKRAFETVFRAMVSVLERSVVDKRRANRATAQAIAALSIGGMVVARTLVDRRHADELRNACMTAALQMGGWSKAPFEKGKPKLVTTLRSRKTG
jgi:TetR/AcrR family transcriptional regulator, transcriptional repressor for nem operon